MIKSKKQMFLVIGVFILVMMLSAVTYAFFNYTRTGVSNTIKVGRISFVTRQTETINLTNVFPISSSEATGENPNYDEVVIEIVGDTDYSGGIEYLVSAVDANIYTTEGQAVPISLDIKIDDDLGTENNNYFVSRENTNTSIYKRIVGDTLVGDGMLLVGYIAPNSVSGTPDGIDGTITIKAYLDKDKILISDTYDGNESDNMGTTNSQAEGKTVITTTEWNALQQNGVSFKVKVEANEGIWVVGSLEEIMKIQNIGLDTENGVDFSKTSNEDGLNGEGTKGVYTRTGTENDDYPIMYYRGDVKDNNVVFNNKCWKAVRTTDTGGVKLIYNGELKTNRRALKEAEYGELLSNEGNYTFDEDNMNWNLMMEETISSDSSKDMSFNLPAGNYLYEISVMASIENDFRVHSGINLTIYINDEYVGYLSEYSGSYGIYKGELNVTDGTDVILVESYGGGSTVSNPSYVSVKFIKEDETLGTGCNNAKNDTLINISEKKMFAFNTNYNSPAYVGYMFGDVYEKVEAASVSGAYYGSSFIFDGTNYKLVDPITTKNNTHHYTCNLTISDGTCTTIRYYYYNNYYINLTGGDSIENAMEKMQTNANNSNAKTQIDTWYVGNMNNVTNKLEDTIWCNDRSIGNGNNNGWIANGGDLNTNLYYGAHERSDYASNTSTVKNQPSLVCTNKNDRFTVNNINGNRALTYPIALLTEDEIVLAGGIFNGNASDYYLNNEGDYTIDTSWIMSPFDISSEMLIRDGIINWDNVSNSRGIRPSVSLKPGQLITKGIGTVTDPYVIE